MVNENETPPPFLPTEFEEWANDILGRDASTIHPSEIPYLYLILSQQQPPSCLILQSNDDSSDSYSSDT